MEFPVAEPEKQKPTTSADRMRAMREKAKLIDANVYVRPLVDTAKDLLKQMADPSIELLFDDPNFRGALDNNHVAQLRTFIKNLKAQRKRDEAASLEKEKEELNIKEKAQRIGNLEISELHRILLDTPSEEERIELMRRKIDENIFVFCEYMEILKPRTENFLKHIIGFYGDLDERKFTMLFVRVCVMHRGEKLEIQPDMVNQTMRFLVDAKHHPTAALGLLKLAYDNQIALTQFPMDFLLKFQAAYENQIIHFIKSLSRVKQHVVESLPPTIFIFTKSLLSTLSAGGDILYVGVPPQFLPYIISIIAYSFDSEPAAFDQFLKVFKEGCNKLYDTLIYSDFQNLLQVIIEQAKGRAPRYFMQLANTSMVIESSFNLLIEKQICKFDQLTVNQLVFGGEEVITMLQQKPKIIQAASLAGLDAVICAVAQANPHFDLDIELLSNPLSETEMSPFRGMGISSLLSVQEIAFKILCYQKKGSRLFFRYETGQGKTALCLGVAALKALQGERAFIVNNSPELTFRDYKKALVLQREVEVSVRHAEEDCSFKYFNNEIVYMSGAIFKTIVASIPQSDLERTCLILDEFDSFLFFESRDSMEDVQLVKKFQKVYGFSGSNLQIQHQKYIENALDGQLVHLEACVKEKIETVCRSVEVYERAKEYQASIVRLAAKQSNLTPVVLILSQGFEQLGRQLSINKIRVENFNKKSGPQIEASMMTFALKSLGRFGVFLINHDQGRGIDFPSSHEIEQSGGVYIIIASLPDNYLSFQQFIGRTGRIGNLGQYSIILLDKEAKNIGAEEFFKKKLEELKNRDIQTVSRLQQKCLPCELKEGSQIQPLATQLEEEKCEPKEDVKFGMVDFHLKTQELIHQLECIETVSEHSVKIINDQEQLHDHFEKRGASETHTPAISRRKAKQLEKAEVSSQRQLRNRDAKRVARDKQYFEGYSEPDIHREMTRDEERMRAYQSSIRELVKDKLVLDVGAGSGILCIMAAQAGASKVCGVELSEYYKVAQQSVKDNSLEGKIEIFHADAESFIVPGGKVDIIISEWMGYFLFFENMLPSVIHSKNENLKEDGIMIPRRAMLRIALFDQEQEINGIILKSLEQLPNSKACIEVLKPERIMSEEWTILDIDLNDIRQWQNCFSSEFELIGARQSIAKGIVAWFDAEMCEGITLSTSPLCPVTHWKQTLLYFQTGVRLEIGEKFVGNMQVSPSPDDHRALFIEIKGSAPSMRKPLNQSFWLQ